MDGFFLPRILEEGEEGATLSPSHTVLSKIPSAVSPWANPDGLLRSPTPQLLAVFSECRGADVKST